MRWITNIVAFLFGRNDDAMLPPLRTDGLNRKAEPKPAEPAKAEKKAVDIAAIALDTANRLLLMVEHDRMLHLAKLKHDNPTLHSLVLDKISQARNLARDLRLNWEPAAAAPEPFPADKPAKKPELFIDGKPTSWEDLQSLMRPDPNKPKDMTNAERSERVGQASAAAASVGVPIGKAMTLDEVSRMFNALPQRQAESPSPRQG